MIVASHIVDGKDPEKGRYYSTVRDIMNAPGFSSRVEPGSRHSLEASLNTFHFAMDDRDRMFVLITEVDYPQRLVFQAIESIRREFTAKFNEKSMNCAEGALDRQARSIIREVCLRFDDRTRVDKVSSLQLEVDKVKGAMQENIERTLNTTQTAESLADKTVLLNQTAKAFNKDAKQLKRMMFWRNLKIKLLFTFLILAILGYIFLPLLKKSKDE